MLTTGIYFLHNNARAHTTRFTTDLNSVGWGVLNHLPYSPNLGTSDFYIFSKLKNALTGQSFTADEYFKEAV